MWKRWNNLQSRFAGDWWSNRSARPKTRRALQTVAKQIPDVDLRRIPRRIIVCAPDPCLAGGKTQSHLTRWLSQPEV